MAVMTPRANELSLLMRAADALLNAALIVVAHRITSALRARRDLPLRQQLAGEVAFVGRRNGSLRRHAATPSNFLGAPTCPAGEARATGLQMKSNYRNVLRTLTKA